MEITKTAAIFEQAKIFAEQASNLIQRRFNSGFQTKQKEDKSLVTEVDLEVEQLLRDQIKQSFPLHGIIGEEQVAHNPKAEYTWVLDPIDGTQSFVHGIPTFGCIVAVYKGQLPIVGIINHPLLNENYSAAKGIRTFCNDIRIQIKDSSSSTIDENEVITICSKRQWALTNQGDLFNRIWDKHQYIRIYYDCFGITRTVAGQCGANILMNVNLWDIAACKILTEEAGGLYIDLGKKDLGNGKQVYSAIFGKASVCKIIKNWFEEK